jgi:UDP-N-acetylmuramyl pentapeptide synthase
LQPKRLERIRLGDYLFLNDAYNANPDSFETSLDVLAQEQALFKGVVAGDMLELGDKAPVLHYQLGRHIADMNLDFLICKGRFANDLISGALDGGMDPDMLHHERTYPGCVNRLVELEGEQVAVLLKGSRACRMEEVIKCFMNYCTR